LALTQSAEDGYHDFNRGAYRSARRRTEKQKPLPSVMNRALP
jgi:hypothetical protein